MIWDYERNSIKVLAQDALEVIGSSNAISDTDISKSSDSVKPVPTDTDVTSIPQDHMISIKKWGRIFLRINN